MIRQLCDYVKQENCESLMSRIVTIFDDDPNRLLVFACHTNDRLIAENAIKRGATLINCAVFCSSMHNYKKLIKYFLKQYRNDEFWNSVLSGACMGNQKRLVEEALNNGADDYQTAFECACNGGNMELVIKFRKMADSDNEGFYQACLTAQMSVVELLWNETIDFELALKYASKSGNVRLIEKIMSKIPNVTVEMLNQCLNGVCYTGVVDNVWKILDNGANDYYNACISSIKGGHDDVIEIFDYHVLVDDAEQACLEGQKREIILIALSLGTIVQEKMYESCLKRRSSLMKKIQLKCYDYM